jgi:Skp family chaperone for outer membrane proteins
MPIGRTHRLGAAAVLAAAVAAAFGAGAAFRGAGAALAAPPAPPPATAVGFVDVDEVMKGYTKTKDLQSKIRGDRDAELKALEEKSQKLSAQKDELELLTRGTPAWQKKDMEIRKEAFAIKLEEERINKDADEKVWRAYRDIYHDINAGIAEIADKKGLAAVFMRSSSEIEGKSEPEIIQKILLRQVLWNHDSLDVTKELIEALNEP